MFELPSPDKTGVVADWIELEVACNRQEVSKSWLSSILEAETGDTVADAFVADVWIEMTARADRYVPSRFEVIGDIVKRTDRFSEAYVACLLYSLYGASGERTDTKLFERMTAAALRAFLAGSAYVFGWPTHGAAPTAIRDRVLDLCQQMNERFAEAPLDHYKDRGLDVVAWKPFSEATAGRSRSSQLIVLTQCAAGHDWRAKTSQLPVAQWKQYVHWACEPVRCLSVPAFVSAEMWHDVSVEAGLIFDRPRLVNSAEDQLDDDLGAELAAWVVSEHDARTS